MTVVYGVQPVREALRARRRIDTIFTTRSGGSSAMRALLEEARTRGVKIRESNDKDLERRAGTDRHQGVVAELAEAGDAATYSEVSDMLAAASAKNEPPLILVLDGIQDPHNLGALIRSAHAFGAHGVVIPKNRAASVTPAVIKASAGAVMHMPIARVVNIKYAIEELKEAGVWSAAAALDGDPIQRSRLDGPLALVIGSEGKGVSPSVAERCDLKVTIALPGGFDSLNASVAGGVLLYETIRQRRALKGT